MKREFSFHVLARRELYDGVDYYESKRRGLGAAFLAEVERAIDFIRTHPEGAPLVRETVRRKLVRRFPYGVHYSVKQDSIRILAIANHKRRPFYWRERQ